MSMSRFGDWSQITWCPTGFSWPFRGKWKASPEVGTITRTLMMSNSGAVTAPSRGPGGLFDVCGSWDSKLVSEMDGIETKEELDQGPSRDDICFHCVITQRVLTLDCWLNTSLCPLSGILTNDGELVGGDDEFSLTTQTIKSIIKFR